MKKRNDIKARARAARRAIGAKEDAALTAAAKSDRDNLPLRARDFAAERRVRGRPKSERTKKLVSLRLDAEVIEAFKAEGPGWQTRINTVLARAARAKRRTG